MPIQRAQINRADLLTSRAPKAQPWNAGCYGRGLLLRGIRARRHQSQKGSCRILLRTSQELLARLEFHPIRRRCCFQNRCLGGTRKS